MSATEEKVTDPVCGMRFKRSKAAATSSYGGRTIYFCTDACRRQFEENPEIFVTSGSGREQEQC